MSIYLGNVPKYYKFKLVVTKLKLMYTKFSSSIVYIFCKRISKFIIVGNKKCV